MLGATADEDGGSLVFSLTLSFAMGTDVTLVYATADGTATAGSDYTGTSGMLTIMANTRLGTVSVPILDDTADEVDEETFTLTVSNVTGATVANTSAEGVIVDDDDSVVSIAGPTAAGTGPGAHLFEGEAGGAGGSWTVSTAAAVPVDLPVNVAVVETGAGDFVPSSGEGAGRLTIAAGTRSVTFNPVVADAVDEGPSTVTVWVAPGPGYAVATGAASAAVAVRDDDLGGDAPFLFSVEPGSATVVEGASPAFEQVVRTVADGTFTEPGDLARVGLSLDGLQLRWGSTTHLETAAGDFTATASTATLAVGDFAAVTTAGGTGLEARRALGGVTVAADTEAEGAERFLVALERAAGNGALLRAAAHPGVPGIATALRGQGFYRVAVTVVDAPTVTLALGEDELFEGATTTVTATMTPPRANAFDVTVGLSSARAEFVGGNTLSFAAGAAESTGTVVVRAVANEADDGDAVVSVRGSAGAAAGADVVVAPAALRVLDDDPRGSAGGAVLWETELTLGQYEDADTHHDFGYADTGSVSGVTASTAGALADATFEFQGVEYTVQRLTLTSSDAATAGGELVAKSTTGGWSLPVESDSAVNLGLELEGAGGEAAMRRLRPGAAKLGVLAKVAQWETATLGDTVTVRLLDLGPVTYWDGTLANPVSTEVGTSGSGRTLNGYWIYRNEATSAVLVPDAFEIAVAGAPVVYTVDHAAGLRAGGIGPPEAGVLDDADPAGGDDEPGGEPAGRRQPGHRRDLPRVPADRRREIRRRRRRRRRPGVRPPLRAFADYVFTPHANEVDTEELRDGIGRAFLLPSAGAGSAAPPPPQPVEIWRGAVTVGEECEQAGDPCAKTAIGYDDGTDEDGNDSRPGSAARAAVSRWRERRPM